MKKILAGFGLLAVLNLAAAQMVNVTSAGIGIGTASPASRLHIYQPSGGANQLTLDTGFGGGNAFALNPFITGVSNGGFEIRDVTNNIARFIVQQNTGNVGIGTASPSFKLHVMGVGRFGINDTANNNIGGVLIASGTGVGGARQYWIGASNPTSHNNNMFEISDYDGSTNSPLLTIYGMHAGSQGGNVGIGTTAPGYKLTVVGDVRGSRFIADSNTYADFVFKPDYRLAPLTEVETAIKREGHLPDIPGEAEVKEHGIDLAGQQAKLLQKVEELTLHLISEEKRIHALENEVERLRKTN